MNARAAAAAYAVAYGLATVIGRQTRAPDNDLALLWPAAVVSFVWALAVLDRRKLAVPSLVALLLVTLAVAPLQDVGLGFSLYFLLVNVAHGLVAAAVYRAGSHRAKLTLLHLRDGLALLFGCALGGLLSGLLGATWVSGLDMEDFDQAAFQIGLRNATTTLLLGALISRTASPRTFARDAGRRPHEGLALVVATVVVIWALCTLASGLPVGFIVLPLSVWAGLRFGVRVGTWHSAAVATAAIVAALRGEGPFVAVDDLVTRIVVSQAFIAVTVIVALGVALVEEDRLRALRRAHDTQHKLAHQALHDPLTGLPNRSLLYQRVEEALAGPPAAEAPTAVLFFDVDRFKSVNDSLGHAVGDALLVALALRMRSAVRPTDTVARIGGDEFVILCPELADPTDADRLAQRVLVEVEAPLQVGDRMIIPTVSGGIALSRPGQSADDLVREADAAMFRAKAGGRGRVEFFTERLREAARRRIRLQDELREAIDEGQFVLHYQPIVDVWTGETEGVEALIRWQHPRLGLLLPEEWLDVAEDRGLLPSVGEWVLRQACQDAARLSSAAGRNLAMHVNISARQLQSGGLADVIRACIAEVGLSPGDLVLEITESEILNRRRTAQAELGRLRAIGVRLAADDFGTGYGTVSQHVSMPVAVIKLHAEFMDAVRVQSGSPAVIEGIARVAHALGVQVIAQGVETAQRADLVKAAGIRRGQGLYWRPAMGADAVVELLRRPATPTMR